MESKAIIEEVKIKSRKGSTNSTSSASTSSSIEEDKINNLNIDKNNLDIEFHQLKNNSNNFEHLITKIEEVKAVLPKKFFILL